jgi:hypothetical protein
MRFDAQDEDPLARTNSGRTAAAGISPGRAYAALDGLLTYLRNQIDSRSDSLIDRVEKSTSTSSSSTGLRQSQGNAIRQALYRQLQTALTTLPSIKVVAFNEMQVLNDDAMRVTLARSKLVTNVIEQSREDLIGLRIRLNALQQAGAFVIPQALLPDHLIDGFLKTLTDLGIPLRTQATVLETYCELGMDQLHQVYLGANRLLIEHGVLPDYYVTSLKHSYYPRFNETTENREELERKFAQLQGALCALSLSDWRPGLLRRLLDTPPRYVPTATQQKTFGRVEAGFLAMRNDTRTSERIRTEMHRLALPVLTVYLTVPDQSAMSDDPVQMFVRQLTLLGHRDTQSPLIEFESIKTVVSRIVSELGREMDIFRIGSQSLFTLSKNEVKRRIVAGAPLAASKVDSCGGFENPEVAKLRVTDELRSVSQGLMLPPPMMQVILKLIAPWMMIRLQRYGESSIAWTEAKTWAAAFFDLMRPASSEEEYSRLSTARRFAVEQLKMRTERSRLPPHELAELLKNFEQYFDELDWTDKSALNAVSRAQSQ